MACTPTSDRTEAQEEIYRTYFAAAKKRAEAREDVLHKEAAELVALQLAVERRTEEQRSANAKLALAEAELRAHIQKAANNQAVYEKIEARARATAEAAFEAAAEK